MGRRLPAWGVSSWLSSRADPHDGLARGQRPRHARLSRVAGFFYRYAQPASLRAHRTRVSPSGNIHPSVPRRSERWPSRLWPRQQRHPQPRSRQEQYAQRSPLPLQALREPHEPLRSSSASHPSPSPSRSPPYTGLQWAWRAAALPVVRYPCRGVPSAGSWRPTPGALPPVMRPASSAGEGCPRARGARVGGGAQRITPARACMPHGDAESCRIVK
jgi:hypothetical protein